mmetsp:Transcript_1328/g.2925  ORF Transcript_1328/g.2925 Transcript_1328/m.2925 type:complete len:112 (+) Transcript_1328:32-367(+)
MYTIFTQYSSKKLCRELASLALSSLSAFRQSLLDCVYKIFAWKVMRVPHVSGKERTERIQCEVLDHLLQKRRIAKAGVSLNLLVDAHAPFALDRKESPHAFLDVWIARRCW